MGFPAENTEQASFEDASTAGQARDMIVPRICIEAFCATPEFANAMRTAAQDRRMAKAKTSVGMGGAAAAAKRYANVGAPNLIVVESQAAGFTIFQELEALAAVCDEETKVIVAGPSNDVTLYREMIRQGVCEYIVTPTAPMQLIEAIAGAYEDPSAQPNGKSVAVYGVRGGVGSSVLSHNIADMLASASERDTILVDLDIEFGTSALGFNVETSNSVADALSDVSGLDDVKFRRLLHQFNDHLHLLPAPAAIHTRLSATEDGVLGLLDVARAASDFVVLDTARQWCGGTRCALRQSDQVILVAAPDLVSLRNLKIVHDWLKTERKYDLPPKIILNQVGEAKRPEISAEEFADILGAPVDLILPYEPALFGAAQNDGKTLAHVAGAQRVVEKLEGG